MRYVYRVTYWEGYFRRGRAFTDASKAIAFAEARDGRLTTYEEPEEPAVNLFAWTLLIGGIVLCVAAIALCVR